MPEYKEILEQSEENIIALKQQIEVFQYLHEDLKRRIEQTSEIPNMYNELFKKIKKLSEDYLKGLGSTVKNYVEVNNKCLQDNIGELKKLNTFLKDEIERLSEVDLEKHFEKHQKSLSEIFKGINDINIGLASITSTLGLISQSISGLGNLLNDTQKRNIEEINIIRNNINDFQSNTQFEFSELKSILDKQNKNQRVDRIIAIVGIIIIMGILLYTNLK